MKVNMIKMKQLSHILLSFVKTIRNQKGMNLAETMLGTAISAVVIYLAWDWYNNYSAANVVVDAKKHSTELAHWVMRHVEKDHNYAVEHMNSSQTAIRPDHLVTPDTYKIEYNYISSRDTRSGAPQFSPHAIYETSCEEAPAVGQRYFEQMNELMEEDCQIKCVPGTRPVISRTLKHAVSKKGAMKGAAESFNLVTAKKGKGPVPNENSGSKVRRTDPIGACIGANWAHIRAGSNIGDSYQVYVNIFYLDVPPKSKEKSKDKKTGKEIEIVGKQKVKLVRLEQIFNAVNVNSGIEIRGDD